MSAWGARRRESICAAIRKPVGFLRFRANVDFLDDAQYQDLTREQLLSLFPEDYDHSFVIVVDHTAMTAPEHPLLILDLFSGTGAVFRAIPSQVQAIENNLSIGNMDFEEFANAVDQDGVFRDFPRY